MHYWSGSKKLYALSMYDWQGKKLFQTLYTKEYDGDTEMEVKLNKGDRIVGF